jgi:cyclopropane-fatty-acyl-phospholipid synthase
VAAFADGMRASPVAVAPEAANAQHYEVPARFFELVLGPHLKYSSGWWPRGVSDLATAEESALELTGWRAGVRDGMDILDLGCGWGSFSLWAARRFPRCRVTAMSNSAVQGEHIRRRARELGLANVDVVTADINHFTTGRRFHRVVSVEMLEHVRNWEVLFARVASWLRPEGAFFLHVFAHRELAYRYEDRGSGDWMARHFFTGGVMPADSLPHHFADHLAVRRHWRLDGRHYSRTLEAWLANMDANRAEIMALFGVTYGADARRWFGRWRMFFMACSELFRYRDGAEWGVSHYRLEPSSSASAGRLLAAVDGALTEPKPATPGAERLAQALPAAADRDSTIVGT